MKLILVWATEGRPATTAISWSEETLASLPCLLDYPNDRLLALDFAETAQPGDFVILPAAGRLLLRAR